MSRKTSQQQREDLRASLFERNAEHEIEFYVLVNEEQAIEMAAGCCPPTVRSMVKTMLDWKESDQRKADAYEAVQAKRRTRTKKSAGVVSDDPAQERPE